MASVNSTVIARVAAGLYDLQLGNASMTWALNAVEKGFRIDIAALEDLDVRGAEQPCAGELGPVASQNRRCEIHRARLGQHCCGENTRQGPAVVGKAARVSGPGSRGRSCASGLPIM